jgi:apolipoprotein N-acyltransferase
VIGIDEGGLNNIKVKDKLVPVEEKIPLKGRLDFLRKIAPSLGKYSFSNREKNKKNFSFKEGNITPLICFESLFSFYVSEAISEGSEAIFVIINEGWFDNVFASNQFSSFSKVRAVENNKWVVRSSNYGTSSIINSMGIEVEKITKRDKSYLEGTVIFNNQKTIFNYFGIYFGYIALVLTFFTTFVPLIKLKM